VTHTACPRPDDKRIRMNATRTAAGVVGADGASLWQCEARATAVILDEFVAVTGYERKYAIRLLLGPNASSSNWAHISSVTTGWP
jgi:hypothetical protein